MYGLLRREIDWASEQSKFANVAVYASLAE
jgi:hypothetical protein